MGIIQFIKSVSKLFIRQILCLFFKPNTKKWVFKGFGDLYIDNCKAFFEYSQYKSDLELIWVTNNEQTFQTIKGKGFNCFYSMSIRGLYHTLTCGIHFYGDYQEYFINNKSIRVNLWHGIPIKKIEFDITKGPLTSGYKNTILSKLLYPQNYSRVDFMISSSDYISKNILSTAFRLDAKKFLNFGLPRNEILLRPNTALRTKLQESNNSSKIYTYLPTWRNNGLTFLDFSDFNLKELNRILKINHSTLCIKPHPKVKLENLNFSNIKIVDHQIDLYELLSITDILISDFSSVIFDFMLTKRPIIYYAYDLKDYIRDHDLYFKYDDIVTTEICTTFKELKDKIVNYSPNSENYQKVSAKIWDCDPSKSSQRIFQYFYDQIN